LKLCHARLKYQLMLQKTIHVYHYSQNAINSVRRFCATVLANYHGDLCMYLQCVRAMMLARLSQNISINRAYSFSIIQFQITHKFIGLVMLLLQNLFFISVPVLCTVSSAKFQALFPATSVRNDVLTPSRAVFPIIVRLWNGVAVPNSAYGATFQFHTVRYSQQHVRPRRVVT
jgi:hypothetical protein